NVSQPVESKRPPNSNTAALSYSSAGPVSTRGPRSPVPDQPNSRTTVRSRLSCPSTTATMPSLPGAANDFFNSLLVVRRRHRLIGSPGVLDFLAHGLPL